MTSSPVTELIAFTIDCPDASRLARFYADLTGGKLADYPDYGAAQVTLADATLNFQTVADYTPPQWPGQDQPQQYHLDFRVSNLEQGVAHARALGATEAEHQPGAGAWTVMIDPDGHPFCLCPPQG